MAIQFVGGNELEFIINLALCLVTGLIIGLEREHKGKSAGIGTHIFVIAGSMLFTMLSTAIEPSQPGRIASGILTGIGFLCAGMIFHEDGEKIANLTTAANIWFSAAIGMAIGFGWYLVAILSSIFVIAVPQLHRFFGNGNNH